ncbi:DNA mismatch repair endonuclease MutL [Planctomycetota bacterium]|nr:DNA mismatch repair endonuclease MutL [Planctomycetota bacterium]
MTRVTWGVVLVTHVEQQLRIRELSPDLINQIAAGEVVERPASVLKELVENAIDAGAKRIVVDIEGGGTRLLRVSDDGHGMVPDELFLAVRSHATSKIRNVNDLFAIRSLGFRGEALASIASVANVRITSRPPEADNGAELEVKGGALGKVRPVGRPPGTTIEVADLFFNVPARRAFLKTERSEVRAVLTELRKLALARADISFSLTTEVKTLVEAPAEDEPRLRISQLLGRDLADSLLAVPRLREGTMAVRGYCSPCDVSRGDSQQQFFFLNGRAIRDSTLLAAIKRAYDSLLPPRRHAHVFLWLDIPPDEVDVNVHPQKAHVRFRRDRDVFHLIVRAVREALKASGFVASLDLNRRGDTPGAFSGVGSGESLGGQQPLGGGEFGAEGGIASQMMLIDSTHPFVQLHRRYVVEETPTGLRIVDPHALHERILYEQIRARLESEPLESQRFLFPQIVEVGALELTMLDERQEQLAALGFELSPFGQTAVGIHAAPRLLAAERVPETVRRLLGDRPTRDPEEAAESGGLVHDLAAALACRSAVRFGDTVPREQLRALLAQREDTPRGHCCPHGRPTALALSLDELDRRFGRQGASA